MSSSAAPELVAALGAGLSMNAQERAAGEAFLQQNETQQGFHYSLLTVVLSRSLPDEVRLQAILLFKNGIEKYWYKRSTQSVCCCKDHAVANL
jgi:hypothetical protein